MIHGFGKFWNIFSFFLLKILDSLLFCTMVHTAIKYINGKETWNISTIVFAVTFGLAIVFSIIHAVRITASANKDKSVQIYETEPEAINVNKRMKSDINVKAHRGFWYGVKIMIIVAVSGIILAIVQSKSGVDFSTQHGSWGPAAVLIVECLVCNIFICRPFRRCKCPMCKRGKAIKYISGDLLESKIGDWSEAYETLEHDEKYYTEYNVGMFGKKTYAGIKKVTTPVIRTKRTEYKNIQLGRYFNHYICRYCGQRFDYESKEFEPIKDK